MIYVGLVSTWYSFSEWMAQSLTPTVHTVGLTLAFAFGNSILSSIMFMDPRHIIPCFVQYIFFIPSFINILYIYAICNLNDVSWGAQEENDLQKLQSLRSLSHDFTGKDYVAVPSRESHQIEKDFCNSRERLQINSFRQSKQVDAYSLTYQDTLNDTRIYTLLFWIMSNIIVVYIQTEESAWSWIHDRLCTLTWESELAQVIPFCFVLSFLYNTISISW